MDNPKILLFCTSFSDNEYLWNNRYIKWLKFYNSINLNSNKILMIDDGSPVVPNIESVSITNSNNLNEEDREYKNSIIRFPNHLGRRGVLDYPGWFRSFSFACEYAKKFNYKKVIHIESDVFLLSDKIINYINDLDSGWNSFMCSRYSFPESGIQIICKDQIDNLYEFYNKDYNLYKNFPIERLIPFTNVSDNFIGDRYGEYLPSPPIGADFCSQFLPEWRI
jgi:hypothetical protein